MTLFETKVKTEEDKFVYAIDALSFTEAEARTLEIAGEGEITSIKRMKVSEVFESDGDKWFMAKVNFIVLDERKGKEKRTASYMLVQSDTTQNALSRVRSEMEKTLSDWEIESVKETKIIELVKYGSAE